VIEHLPSKLEVLSSNPSGAKLKKKKRCQVPVVMPVILTTWEAEIRRIVVQGQPGQIVPEATFPKYPE
jgi:hypothetical protein